MSGKDGKVLTKKADEIVKGPIKGMGPDKKGATPGPSFWKGKGNKAALIAKINRGITKQLEASDSEKSDPRLMPKREAPKVQDESKKTTSDVTAGSGGAKTLTQTS